MRTRSHRAILAGLLVLACGLAVAAGIPPALARAASASQPAAERPPVRYEVVLDAPHTQMVDIVMHVPPTGSGAVEAVLPAWRPGRYEILDPAGTVRGMTATAPDGTALDVEKIAKARWRISGTAGDAFTLRWRVYANAIGNRTRHVDDTHAFLNPSSCFLYVPELRDRAIEVDCSRRPAGWRIATGLAPEPGAPAVVTAANYDELADAPLEIGEQDVLRFEVDGVPHEIVLWPAGERYDAERMIADFRGIVEAGLEIFGRLPYERYVFMIHVGAGGGGTEHVHSTIMQTSRRNIEASLMAADGDEGAWRRFLGLVAHEHFHVWNVKQFRPKGLKPYDYERENYTDLLWVAEGTTSYYDELLLVRAGLHDADGFLERMGSAIDAHRRRPGARVQSLARSSFDAWVVFNRRTPDAVNCSVSFYSGGMLASMLIDLELRARTEGAASMDDVMLELFRRFPLEARGYDEGDLRAILRELAGGDAAAIDALLDRHVRDTEPMDFTRGLAAVGLELVLEPNEDAADGAPATRSRLGVSLRDRDGLATVRSVRSDGPAYAAGIQADDVLLAMDGVRLRAGDLDRRLALLEPGAPVRLTLFRRDRLREIEVVPAGEPDASWTIREVEEPTEAQLAAREAWLGAAAARPQSGK